MALVQSRMRLRAILAREPLLDGFPALSESWNRGRAIVTQLRFVERMLPLTSAQIENRVPDAGYVMNVEIYLEHPFRGSITITCDGMMMMAVTSSVSWMSAFKGTAYTINVDTAKLQSQSAPIVVTVYAKSEIHVSEVTLRE